MRDQIIKEQFANSDVRRVLGFGNSGAPALMGLIDLIPGQIRLLRTGGDVNNKFEFRDWIGGTTSGLSGSWSNSPNFVLPLSVVTVVAIVVGLAEDGTQGYGSMISACFRREAAGDEQIIGVSNLIFENKSQAGASSSIAGVGSGGVTINFDSGQLVIPYVWSIKAFVVANTNP